MLELAIVGSLAERPLHGYQLNRPRQALPLTAASRAGLLSTTRATSHAQPCGLNETITAEATEATGRNG